MRTSGDNLLKTPVIAILILRISRIRNPHFRRSGIASSLPSCRLQYIAEMLRSASLIILLVAIAATSADFECPDVEGIFPDPDDCRSFYQGSIYALDDYYY